MATKELLSVKEVAEIAGISQQAIYKRLNKDFQPYVVEVEKKKWLKYSVLKHFTDNYSTKKVEYNTEVEILKKLIEVLEKENKIKQSTIESLTAKLEEEHRHLLNLTEQVGSTLQVVTQTQLADRILEGQQCISASDSVTQEEAPTRTKWKFWKK